MGTNKNQPQRFSMEQAKAIAESDAGKNLYAALKKSHGEQLSKAMEQATSGDFTQMKQMLSEMMTSPEIQAIISQLGGNTDG